MGRTRVLIVARMAPTRNSRTRFLAETLSQKFDVTVVSEEDKLASSEAVQVCAYRWIGVRLLWPRRSWHHILGGVRVLQLSLRGAVEAFKHDIIVCSDVPYAFPLLVSKVLLRKHTVLNAHEVAWACGANRAISCFLKLLESVVLRSCDFFLVPSVQRANIMLSAHGLHTPSVMYANLPAGASLREPVPQACDFSADRIPAVIFLGSISPANGLMELVEASATGGFRLIIQGDGRFLPNLMERRHAFVEFLPPCPNDQCLRAMAVADLAFVYYRNDCLNSAWACSTKFYTAVFAMKPIVCNRLPAFEAFAEEFGGCIFLDSLDPGEIRRKLEAIVAQPGEYGRLVSEMARARQACLEWRDPELLLARFEALLSSPSHCPAVA